MQSWQQYRVSVWGLGTARKPAHLTQREVREPPDFVIPVPTQLPTSCPRG